MAGSRKLWWLEQMIKALLRRKFFQTLYNGNEIGVASG